MPVSDQHKLYTESLPYWKLGRDASKGSEAIKKARTIYLPMPNSLDQSDENVQRYNDYLHRACYVNFTGQTKEGLIGMAFLKPPTDEIPEKLQYLKTSISGNSLSMIQFIKRLISDQCDTGRGGILTDYPSVPDGLTQIQTNSLRANILRYKAEDIINWKTENINGASVLVMVVLKEPKSNPSEDGFSSEEVIHHRVLKLTDGVYSQEVYDDKDNLISFAVPRNAKNATWDKIPFTFFGSENNSSDIDKALLIDIAMTNIAHYLNSADYEESSHIVGQPTPYASGLTQAWIDSVWEGTLTLGSRAFLPLPENGTAGLLQASPNSMPKEGMSMKEDQMVKIGARIIADSSGIETAEAAKIRFSGQNSKLSSALGNLEDALIQSFGWAGEFMGADGDIDLRLNRQFYDATIAPEKIMANIQLIDRGIITVSDLRDTLRESGELKRTDDEINEENLMINPLA